MKQTPDLSKILKDIEVQNLTIRVTLLLLVRDLQNNALSPAFLVEEIKYYKVPIKREDIENITRLALNQGVSRRAVQSELVVYCQLIGLVHFHE